MILGNKIWGFGGEWMGFSNVIFDISTHLFEYIILIQTLSFHDRSVTHWWYLLVGQKVNFWRADGYIARVMAIMTVSDCIWNYDFGNRNQVRPHLFSRFPSSWFPENSSNRKPICDSNERSWNSLKPESWRRDKKSHRTLNMVQRTKTEGKLFYSC